MDKTILLKRIASGKDFFNYPSGICLHPEDNMIYIADMHNHRICYLKEDGTTGALSNTVVGVKNCKSLGRPLALCITAQKTLYVTDAQHNKIFYKSGREEGWKPIKIDINFYFNLPGGIAIDKNENIYASDFLSNRLVKVTPNGTVTILLEGEENLNKPYGIFFQNNKLYYTDTGNARVCYIDLDNGQVHRLNPHVETKGLSAPIAIALDEAGNIYISEQRRMYFLDIKKYILSLVIDRDIWKEHMDKYLIQDRLCHIGSLVVRDKGEIYWVDTIKGSIYKMILKKH